MLSPVRSRPPGDEEWSLLSSCIGDMEETDLLAFDEDLADASVWEENDMGTGPDGKMAMLPECPSPTPMSPISKPLPANPPRLQRQRGGGRRRPLSPPPTRGRAAHDEGARTPPRRQCPLNPQGTPRAELLGLSPSEVLRQCGDTPSREALARTSRSKGGTRALRRGLAQDLFGEALDGVALDGVGSSLDLAPEETPPPQGGGLGECDYRGVPRLVRKLSFGAPPLAEESDSMERARLVEPSSRRTASPFGTLKPPPGNLASLRVINRMVNHSPRPPQQRGRAARPPAPPKPASSIGKRGAAKRAAPAPTPAAAPPAAAPPASAAASAETPTKGVRGLRRVGESLRPGAPRPGESAAAGGAEGGERRLAEGGGLALGAVQPAAPVSFGTVGGITLLTPAAKRAAEAKPASKPATAPPKRLSPRRLVAHATPTGRPGITFRSMKPRGGSLGTAGDGK